MYLPACRNTHAQPRRTGRRVGLWETCGRFVKEINYSLYGREDSRCLPWYRAFSRWETPNDRGWRHPWSLRLAPAGGRDLHPCSETFPVIKGLLTSSVSPSSFFYLPCVLLVVMPHLLRNQVMSYSQIVRILFQISWVSFYMGRNREVTVKVDWSGKCCCQIDGRSRYFRLGQDCSPESIYFSGHLSLKRLSRFATSGYSVWRWNRFDSRLPFLGIHYNNVWNFYVFSGSGL